MCGKEGKKQVRDRGREMQGEHKKKTTLSKEGFKDYQLRLLGNLRSCILPTSKGRCVLEYCKWESERGGGEGMEEGENLISLINADTGPV